MTSDEFLMQKVQTVALIAGNLCASIGGGITPEQAVKRAMAFFDEAEKQVVAEDLVGSK